MRKAKRFQFFLNQGDFDKLKIIQESHFHPNISDSIRFCLRDCQLQKNGKATHNIEYGDGIRFSCWLREEDFERIADILKKKKLKTASSAIRFAIRFQYQREKNANSKQSKPID